MWMLRGKPNRWGPGKQDSAIRDLRLDDDGLSLHLVHDHEDAHQIAAAYVLRFKEESRHEWILIPDDCIGEYPCEADPEGLPRPIRERHHLLKLQAEDLLPFAKRACDHPALDSFKQNIPEIKALAPALIEQYQLEITDYWQKLLAS